MSALVGCALAPVEEPRSTDNNAPIVHDVQRRLAEIFDAAEKKDFRRLDSYHFYGPQFSKFAGLTFSRLNAREAQAGEHKGLGAVSDLQMHADDLKIDVFPGSAIATFVLKYSFRAGAARIEKKERATLVFVNRGGEWLIAHEHLSAPSGK